MSLINVNMRTSLVIHKLERGLAYLRVSSEFECGVFADLSGYSQHRQSLAYPEVSVDFENGHYADHSGYPQHRQRSGLPWSVW